MALALADRLLTIVVTATLTSAGWIVAGGSLGGIRLSDAAGSAGPEVARVADPAGSPAVAGIAAGERLIVPVTGIRPGQLVDTFDDGRGENTRRHEALDIMAPAGTPVVAAAGGTIEKLFLSKDGGNTIYLRTPDRATIHYYAHLRAYAPGLKEGQEVRQGGTLGKVGSTGNASPDAPHLHFAVSQTTPQSEWRDPGTAINPYALLVRH